MNSIEFLNGPCIRYWDARHSPILKSDGFNNEIES